MAKVSSLTIKKQSGTSNTHFATWVFNENTKNTTVSSGAIKKGDLVSIKSGATYYNGVAIPSWVMSQKWYVLEVYGNRAVINRNQSGTNSIMSPIHVGNLIGGSGGSSSTTIINTLDHYEVKWTYDTGDGVWFDGGSSDVKVKNATYNAPEGSIKIKATVNQYLRSIKLTVKILLTGVVHPFLLHIPFLSILQKHHLRHQSALKSINLRQRLTIYLMQEPIRYNLKFTRVQNVLAPVQ